MSHVKGSLDVLLTALDCFDVMVVAATNDPKNSEQWVMAMTAFDELEKAKQIWQDSEEFAESE